MLKFTWTLSIGLLKIAIPVFIIAAICAIIYVMLYRAKEKAKEKINQKIASIKTDGGICPKCGGKLIMRDGKYGRFIGCTNFPKCKYTEKNKW